jgi:hypothetical protein
MRLGMSRFYNRTLQHRMSATLRTSVSPIEWLILLGLIVAGIPVWDWFYKTQRLPQQLSPHRP